jgi:hypothetical protein
MGTTASVNVVAGMEFVLLGSSLAAGVEMIGEDKHIFLHQDVTSPNEGVSIDQMIADVRQMMGLDSSAAVPGLSSDLINKQLAVVRDPNSTFNLGSVRIVLRTAYVDILIPKTGNKTVEYAFRVDVNAEGLIPASIELVNIKRISLAVWNTTNEKIKKQLSISNDSAL